MMALLESTKDERKARKLFDATYEDFATMAEKIRKSASA